MDVALSEGDAADLPLARGAAYLWFYKTCNTAVFKGRLPKVTTVCPYKHCWNENMKLAYERLSSRELSLYVNVVSTEIPGWKSLLASEMKRVYCFLKDPDVDERGSLDARMQAFLNSNGP